MAIFARVQDGIVVELFAPPDGYMIADCFVPEVAASFVAVPVGVVPEAGWTFDGITFAAPIIAPPPGLTAGAVLAEKLALGIAITSTATPALNATYALDPTTLDQIGSVARDAASGLGLPGGATTFVYPDATGAPHAFTEADIIALYKAMRDLMLLLTTAAQTMKFGGSATWPPQTATIA